MDHPTIPEAGGIASELVWDARRHGVAKLPRDTSVTTGDDDGAPPGSLLAAAADASLMVEFLTRAEGAGVTVLGYVSATRFESPATAGNVDRLVLLPSILIEADAAVVTERLLRESFHAAPVIRALGEHVMLEGHIELLAPPEASP